MFSDELASSAQNRWVSVHTGMSLVPSGAAYILGMVIRRWAASSETGQQRGQRHSCDGFAEASAKASPLHGRRRQLPSPVALCTAALRRRGRQWMIAKLASRPIHRRKAGSADRAFGQRRLGDKRAPASAGALMASGVEVAAVYTRVSPPVRRGRRRRPHEHLRVLEWEAMHPAADLVPDPLRGEKACLRADPEAP